MDGVMLQEGSIISSKSGRKIRIDRLLKAGGQGTVYLGTDLRTNQPVVVKIFHDKFDRNETIQRMTFLIDQRLGDICPSLAAPFDAIIKKSVIGHIAPYIPGIRLEEFLEKPTCTFQERLNLALEAASLTNKLHGRQIAFGDIHANNFIVCKKGSTYILSLIDFDNFNASGLPAPPMAGHSLYLTPEIRSNMVNRKRVVPNFETDRYALGILQSEIILLFHPACGSDESEAAVAKAMSEPWRFDPSIGSNDPASAEMCSVRILSSDICRLFRSTFGKDRTARPSAAQWIITLEEALKRVYLCPVCGCPTIIDSSKFACPLHQHPFPILTLLIKPTGQRIRLNRGVVVLGRKELGQSSSVSRQHVICRRFGPEAWLEPIGQNGTERWSGYNWKRLSNNVPVLIQAKDRLRFADVEVEVMI